MSILLSSLSNFHRWLINKYSRMFWPLFNTELWTYNPFPLHHNLEKKKLNIDFGFLILLQEMSFRVRFLEYTATCQRTFKINLARSVEIGGGGKWVKSLDQSSPYHKLRSAYPSSRTSSLLTCYGSIFYFIHLENTVQVPSCGTVDHGPFQIIKCY